MNSNDETGRFFDGNTWCFYEKNGPMLGLSIPGAPAAAALRCIKNEIRYNNLGRVFTVCTMASHDAPIQRHTFEIRLDAEGRSCEAVSQ